MPEDLPNLSLNFLNPESRRIAKLYDRWRLQQEKHRDFLCKLLNIHVLWCGEFCITQPGVVFECAIAEAALHQKKEFLTARLIRVPMKGMDIEKFLIERRQEYSTMKGYFPDLFENRDFLLPEVADAVIPKLTSTGANIASNWERLFEKPEELVLPRWSTVEDVDKLKRIAPLTNGLIERGQPLTWPELRKSIEDTVPGAYLETSQWWLQHLYLGDYSTNHDLKVITHLPQVLPYIGYLLRDPRNDYELIRDVMNFWNLFQIIEALPDSRIIQIRAGAGFARFRAVFDDIARTSGKIVTTKNAFARLHGRIPISETKDVTKLLTSARPIQIEKGIGQLNRLFGLIADEGEKLLSQDVSEAPKKTANDKRSMIVKSQQLDLLSKEKNVDKKTVFIGHGRSPVWKDLKLYLNDRLKLHAEEFDSVSIAGTTTVERLENMLENASFAFLVMTAEDLDAAGNMHARENVVHEVGLFQGKLGFKKAIVMLEEGCNEFSNITGLGQIRFPKGNLESAKDRIRHALEQAGLI
ncbi:nucleotide-binding protein [Pararhizobium sp. YC-54]|uniref:nucleotide-binding protein n=1 Tax=Pararhizobium sp. YC-54 TaxID=2986920 RepID=UPI0021F78DB3|nr:nucleotide-binding protein [Pararhizobium sp. YC-54]MCV9999454.1 nucleotide-binding protein [Pararhizobium sp. YC-54]